MTPTDTFLAELVHYVTAWQSAVPVGPGMSHSHDAFEIIYHKSGQGLVRIDTEGELPFARATVQVVPPGRVHRQRQVERGTDCCILFRTPEHLRERLRQTLSFGIDASAYPAHELLALSVLPRPNSEVEQQICDCRLTAALLRLLAHVGISGGGAPRLSRQEQLAKDAYEYIRVNWRTIREIRQVAEELGISTDYLRHLFSARFGMTVHDFVTQMRFDHARALLLNSQLPQKAIAAICGFAEIQQFSRRFRQVMGVAPGAFRKQHAIGRVPLSATGDHASGAVSW